MFNLKDEDFPALGTNYDRSAKTTDEDLYTDKKVNYSSWNDCYLYSFSCYKPPDITEEQKRAGIFKVLMSDWSEKYYKKELKFQYISLVHDIENLQRDRPKVNL